MTPETKATQSATDVVWLPPAEAARVVGVSRPTVFRYMRDGIVPTIRIGPRVRRVAVPRALVESARVMADESGGAR
jgi:excisionase family DNA binding protein